MRVIPLLLVLTLATAGCLSDLANGGRVSATDIVGGKYDKWVIEIDYTPGERPSNDVVNAMLAEVRPLVNKDSVQATFSDGDLPSKDRWTRSALDDLHQQTRDVKTSGDTVATHVMFVDGVYEQNNVLGVAVGHEYVAIFSERIENSCTPANLCFASDEVRVRKAVLIHEIGHILGLVDNGIEMQKPHSDGGAHSNNERSVMFASAETTGIFGLNEIPMQFDEDDRADLCAVSKTC